MSLNEPTKKMSQVNLDALISREDLFRVDDKTIADPIPDFKTLRIDADLRATSHFIKSLRKADFQRVTSEWKPERVAGLIRSFINEDIIPACILWSWKGYSYIIDGGHRLSALVAWINDDYGDREKSKNYFGAEKITKKQKSIADKTRKLIDNDPTIGAFAKYEYAINHSSEVTAEEFSRAVQITAKNTIEVQWIRAKNSGEAEKAFFKINGEATPINDTEALILKSRKKPNGISARAIMHAGSVHKYWKDFDETIKKKIEEISKKVNSLLFDPPLDHTTAKFPCGGDEYADQSLEVVFAIVNMINNLDDSNLKRKQLLKQEADNIPPAADTDGTGTIEYLERVKRIISIISGTAKDPISLGLSPVIYFYSRRGRFQITALFAIVSIAIEWDAERKATNSLVFQNFCAVRNRFEDFLIENKDFVAQTNFIIGSGFKSYKKLALLFIFIINGLIENKSNDEILTEMKSNPEFGFIKVYKAEHEYEAVRNAPGKRIPKETANELIIKAYLSAKLLCPICGGHATFDSYNIDHILQQRNAGSSALANLQLSHVYCNENKEKIAEIKEKIANKTKQATSL